MKIETAGELLKGRVESSTILPLKETPLHIAAAEIIEMARAYLSDGGAFLKSGDGVNALASYAYGLGWLDTGVYTGLLSYTDTKPFMTLECDDEIPESLKEHLEEKTGRYHRMLDSAIISVVPAPDTESPVYVAASRITEEAKKHLKIGTDYENKTEENMSLSSALWHFSYGYGWLDAGVRTGILAIIGDRKLFTV